MPVKPAPPPTTATPLRTVALPSGEPVPCLGLGTWMMGERRVDRKREADALRLGLDLGMRLIDTAEMYAEGGAEEVVAEAVSGRRDCVFLVSKVYPHNATGNGAVAACERSLRRLRTDWIDLYLLHWRGTVPLAETVGAFERLVAAGKIRYWGVSNLDVGDMEELVALSGGPACATNQVLYNVGARGIEWDLLPWLAKRRIPIMAYSPLGQGALLRQAAIRRIAAARRVDAAQVLLAWVLRRKDIIAIPKAVDPEHVRANRSAHDFVLEPAEIEALDRTFPPPRKGSPLAMI